MVVVDSAEDSEDSVDSADSAAADSSNPRRSSASGREALMKIKCWMPAKLICFAGAMAVCGCVAPGAAPMQGLPAQQPQKSSWLAKLPFKNPVQGKSKTESARTATFEDGPPPEVAAAKGGKKK